VQAATAAPAGEDVDFEYPRQEVTFMQLSGRVALVTGGGSGIGRASARRLAAEGMRVCVVDVNGDAARAVADEIGGLAVTADVSNSAQVDAAFTACVEAFGGIDVALLNAGVAMLRELGTLTDEDYHLTRGVNLDGVVFGARAAIRAIRGRTDGRKGGVILATSSVAGIDPTGVPDPIYALTKHGVVGLVRALAPALASEGIAVHAICPGLTDTAILPDPVKAAFVGMGIPLAKPDQVADAVVAAASAGPEASGSCWVVQPDETFAHRFNDVPGPHKRLARS
jgi:NAD(P)-dependent dehydrogenase (short-subunit alcohol dehydrogenase family)